MILVLGGTLDSRELTGALLRAGHKICYSTLTSIQSDQLLDDPNLLKISGQLDTESLRETMIIYGINAVIDATHPYAKEISQNAIWSCDAANIPYLRMERPSLIDEDSLVCDSYDEAKKKLNELLKDSDKNILLTTGSRQLECFEGLPKNRIFARVLPTSGVLKKCENLGYKPKQILAVQGPFSVLMNQTMIKEYQIGFMVTKDSGDVGGITEKIEAAHLEDVKILFIKRPEVIYPNCVNSLDQALSWVEKL
ncbi:precorrin-6A reductase [Eubacteriaceae bacterium ES3]|nr:precorrin-6A reductase [Eubacteriaceae bacterium ES3]